MQQFNHFNQSNQYSEQTRLENKWDHSSGLRNYSHYSHWCLRDVHQLSSHIKNNEVTALVWWFLLAVACQCFLCCKTVELSIGLGQRDMQTKNGAKLRDKVLDLSVINGLMLTKKKS